jgi:hypothetical protein
MHKEKVAAKFTSLHERATNKNYENPLSYNRNVYKNAAYYTIWLQDLNSGVRVLKNTRYVKMKQQPNKTQ